MSRLAEIDLERQDSLSEASFNHAEAYDTYMKLLDRYPPAHRTPEQSKEIEKALWHLELMVIRRDQAQRERFSVTLKTA